jgi:hypothetical protein
MRTLSFLFRGQHDATRKAVRRLSLALLVTIAAGLAFARPAEADTHVSGAYYIDTTWSLAGSPYILDGNVAVRSGVTLTIEPGVIVKFNGQFRELFVDGTLSAVGTGSSPIVFTSIQDDTVGGDSNGDGGATTPGPGQWYAISFGSSSIGSILQYADIRNGGYGSSAWNYGAVAVSGSVLIADSYIHDNQQSGIWVFRGRATVMDSTIVRNENGVSTNMGEFFMQNGTVAYNRNDGLWFNLTSTYSGAASMIMDSDIKHNSGDGIEIGVDRTLFVSAWPHGTQNNIFDNRSQKQIRLTGYHPVPPHYYQVDWKGNYWGDVYFWYNPPACSSVAPYALGHLAYTSSNPPPGPGGLVPPPDGPLPWRSYLAGSGNNVVYCAYDRFPVNPDEFSPTYIPTAGRLPLAATETAFAPELRYDIFETYRADAASIITDNYTSEYSNMLNTMNFGYLAASDPSYPSDTLTLDYLGSSYPNWGAATADDWIDEVNNYAADAQRLHALPQYADRTYAQYVDQPDGSVVIQYWFFYYYNPKTYFGIGAHEGDWEMMQIHLDPGGKPIEAAYSQHSWGERCDWIHVPREEDGRPIVYVAEGSHANYFSPGYHANSGANDTAGGNGEWVIPLPVDVTSGPRWLGWPGHWGGSESSPSGPAQKGAQWEYPLVWQTGIHGCTEEQTFEDPMYATLNKRKRPSVGLRTSVAHATVTARPPLPRVTVRRTGKSVIIRYAFRTPVPKGKSRGPWLLLTSVKSKSSRYVPLTRRTVIHGTRGRIVQSLGRGRAPFRISIAVLAKNGSRSKTLSLRLR